MSKQLTAEELIRLGKALPKWAMNKVNIIDCELGYAEQQIKILETMNQITADHEYSWYTLPNNHDEPVKLFVLEKDNARMICSVPANGTMFIGYKKKEN